MKVLVFHCFLIVKINVWLLILDYVKLWKKVKINYGIVSSVYEHAVLWHDVNSLGQHAHYNADSTGNWFEFE